MMVIVSAAQANEASNQGSDNELGKYRFTNEQEECFEKMRSLYDGTDGLKW